MARRHSAGFRFLETGKLIEGDLQLILVEEYPGDRAKNYSPAYKFRMIPRGEESEIGHIELRIADTCIRGIVYGGNIAYGVLPEHRGRKYAARACKLLLPLARRHGLQELWITCNPHNIASRRTAELAGAQLVEVVDLPEQTELYQEGEPCMCRYRIRL